MWQPYTENIPIKNDPQENNNKQRRGEPQDWRAQRCASVAVPRSAPAARQEHAACLSW